ncbi:hypothetical protein [Pseudobacteriovorax antillogorgiicola]|uniref:HAMP domain-containing protein n=1 Tax=Pseudobacteriovorax antillogorgiicola TaxID=1513793 RepID=A0A1Y6CJW4_9BACT|nr:hypothetical protein [Pseudobacteriovorax antillogorgiicola]TCS47659.1 hypothetical protein EDD56_120100 [Pseudobacteriovorax antillogorgiicola]SMF59789.1 hypothetical protein SAMN06296036_12040 [Pseudobacteriovorax antillogorgiicola]
MTEKEPGLTKRKFSGWLLEPLVQTKIGLYCIALSAIFAFVIGIIIYTNFADLVQSILVLTDAPDEVRNIFAEYWSSIQGWIYFSLATYIFATIGVSIWYTHRFVGPAIAFRKHLEEMAKGNFEYQTVLRKGDAMEDVAKALNRASELLMNDQA